jgi:hypothetical protein
MVEAADTFELHATAAGISRDWDAVKAASPLPWSSGDIEEPREPD